MNPFAELRDELLASELAFDVVWHPDPPGSAPVTGLRALMPGRDRVGELGDIQVRQDVLVLELSRAALPDPRRDDELELLGRRYRVSAVAPADRDPDLWWRVSAYVVPTC